MPLIVIADAVMDVFIRFVFWVPRADWIMPDVVVAVDVVMLTVPLWVMLPCRYTFPLDWLIVRFPVPVTPYMPNADEV